MPCLDNETVCNEYASCVIKGCPMSSGLQGSAGQTKRLTRRTIDALRG
jgi:hypothetical protein